MPKIKYRFVLTQEERDELEAIVSKGKHNSQKVINALILLNYDGDSSKPRTLGEQDIANVLKCSAMKIHRTKQRFVEEGMNIALNGRKGREFISVRPMGILKHTLLRSVAVLHRKGKRNGRCAYSRIRLWSWDILKVSRMKLSGAF